MSEEEVCFVCGINSDFEPLFEAIANEEIVLVCQDCSTKEGLPLLRKPTEEQIKESKTPYSRREVFARISGFRRGQDVISSVSREKEKLEKQKETKLPEKITLNYLQERMLRQREAIRGNEQSSINLVENFHWHILRARRLSKLTAKELAEKLKENEDSIKMLEEGKIPRGVEPLIKKIEQFFNIQLVKAPSNFSIGLRKVDIPSGIKQEIRQAEIISKPQQQPMQNPQPPRQAQYSQPQKTLREIRESQKLSPDKLKNPTIDDLVKLKKEKEAKKF